MQIKTEELIKSIESQLHGTYECPLLCSQYASWVLEHILKVSKAEIITFDTINLSEQQQTMLSDWIDKLVNKHMPIAYLIGSVPFDGVTVLVESPILIPRPETEEWTVKLINELKQLDNKQITILDVCTGSGCIALALAKNLPESHIIALDISDKAVEIIKRNCAYNHITNIEIIKSDLFKEIPKNYTFDLIVGNPPYIDEDDWDGLDASVKKWEDKTALIAQNHGMAIIERIIDDAKNFLKPNPSMEAVGIAQLIVEIDCTQGMRVLNKLENAGYCNNIIEKDLEGKDRVAKGRLVPCGHLK